MQCRTAVVVFDLDVNTTVQEQFDYVRLSCPRSGVQRYQRGVPVIAGSIGSFADKQPNKLEMAEVTYVQKEYVQADILHSRPQERLESLA